MLKKLTLLAMSVSALLAFAAPAAQANGSLITNVFGAEAKEITATSTNTKIVSGIGTLECGTTIWKLTLAENANTTAKGVGTGEAKGAAGAHTGHCKFTSGLLVTFTSLTINSFHLTKHNGETTGTANVSFTYDMYSAQTGFAAECTFGGTLVVRRTAADKVHVAGEVTKTAGSAFCPGSGSHSGDFTVVDEGGTTPTIH